MSSRFTRRRTHPPSLLVLALVALTALAADACGKKGPPLAPLLRIPAAAQASARRLGDTVFITLTIPSANQDNSTPADVSRVDVYGYTGTPENDDELMKQGTLVARVPVRKPPTPAEQERARPGETPTPRAGEQAESGFEQGVTVTVSETLTPELLVPREPAARKAANPPPVAAPTGPARARPSRVYVAVPFNHRGRRGLSTRLSVPVEPAPPTPTDVKVTVTEAQVALTWTSPAPPRTAVESAGRGTEATTPTAPPAGAAQPPAGPPSTPPAVTPPATPPGVTPPGTPPGQAMPAAAAPPTAGGWMFNVYAVPPSSSPVEQAGATKPGGTVTPPTPLNGTPLTHPGFAEPVSFDVERCYVVRTIAAVGAVQQESAPSPVQCVTPKDVFPPAAPKGLTAVTSAGVVSLLWEPSTEPDLAGYLVVRGEVPGGSLEPVLKAPTRETTFNDTTARAGTRYVYAVVALDKAGNISAQSNRVEETAR